MAPVPLPSPPIEGRRPPRPLPEPWITGEDPGAIVPGADRVLGQPSPDRHAGDLLDDPAGDRRARELLRGPARERHAVLCGQLACQRDHFSACVWGGKPGAGPASVGPRARPCLARKTACATATRLRGGSSIAVRSDRCVGPVRRVAPVGRGSLANTATYTRA